jgi:hypothetical protein
LHNNDRLTVAIDGEAWTAADRYALVARREGDDRTLSLFFLLTLAQGDHDLTLFGDYSAQLSLGSSYLLSESGTWAAG